MTRTSLRDVTCSIARTVDILGDAWSWLIVRDVFLGVRRFDALCTDLGVSRKVLAERLRQLTEADILTKHTAEDRFDYQLTEKGQDLVPILAALVTWGDRWEATPAGPPLHLEHAECGVITAEVTCSRCGEPLDSRSLMTYPGPGGRPGPGTALLAGYLRRAHEDS